MPLSLLKFRISNTYTIIVVKCRHTRCRMPAETERLYCKEHDTLPLSWWLKWLKWLKVVPNE
jgi:hypothetical protein